MHEVEARRYRITGVLGKGGFGKVYRATLEGAGGFHKSVAIKLLRDEDVPELTLQRFRDEARILGLVRDRAIVNVDPPTRLAGRWAVVMEYVEGASIQRLMKLGPIPASVAAEIVQEVARVLDKVYRTAGPGGEPLRLLHRDIKPANLQLTPDGEVKVLDFGIAKADFSAREAHTQAYVGGTKGFIAPERLEGIDGPEGDVFSLGVTAHLMIIGDRPTRRQMMGLEDPDTSELTREAQRMIELCTRMRNVDPAQRPTAREVEETCAMIRRQSEGETLRRWAEETVARSNALRQDDEMVGSVLSETLAAVMPSQERLRSGYHFVDPPPAQRGVPRLAWAGLGLILVAAVVMLATSAGSFVLGSGVLLLGLGQPEVVAKAPGTRPPLLTETLPPAASLPVELPTPIEPENVPEPADPTPEPEPEPEPEPTAPAPDPSPTPAPVAVVPASPAPAPPEPSPAEAVAEIAVTFASVPLGADVYVDGRALGRTPVLGATLAPGAHTVKMMSDSETILRTVTVGGRNPTRYVWKGGDAWEAHY